MNADEWIKTLEEWFAKLPPLPKGVQEFLVAVAPWVALIFGVLGVLFSLAATGILAVLSPLVALGGGLGAATGNVVGAVLSLAASGLLLAAFPGLKDHQVAGWKMTFWSQAVSVLGSLVALNLVGAAVSALIGFYLLFQIKSYYK